MSTICAPCTPFRQSETKVSARKIKSLVYVNIKGNADKLVDEMVKKDPRPNFHAEMGYSNAPDSPDRFDSENYDNVIKNINDIPLILPPSDDDLLL